MYSINEWDPLKKVIVGIADHAKIPPLDISLRTVNYADVTDESTIPNGNYPQQVIDESNEDLEIFCKFLTDCNVEVVRPKPNNVDYYNYCPRDNIIVYGDKAIAAPMSLSARKEEYLSYQKYVQNLHVVPNDQSESLYNRDCIGNPDILALHDHSPKFDAANVIRANDHLLYLVSNSGNKAGLRYLQEYLGPDVKVHALENVYSYMHIDSTVAFLREGLMLLNPSRVTDIMLMPEPFRSWDYIMSPEPVDIGHYPGYCHSSKWVNVNLFSINPNLVVIEEHQEPLRKELEKHGIECAMLPLRHARTLGGVFHCVTLDLVRQ